MKEDKSQDLIRVVFEEAERQSAAYDGDKQIGECQYRVDGVGKWVIVHTGVRPEYNGRGIAGFTDEEIAPLFAGARDLTNVVLPHGWREMM